jgi:putative transposase
MTPIGRRKLPHHLPSGVIAGPENDAFFITICCIPRHKNQLALSSSWQAISETVALREHNGDLKCRLLLVMPDHLHGIFEFPGAKPMAKVMTDFKAWLAKSAGIVWQRDFFDHRLRGWESAAEKAKYIRLNPVRAGLVASPEDWPYQR